ncbi:MAG: PHP-associated domain-containing protein [Candidatus Peregrinibacteria bacterium]|nr:PHP-associated domain-containing protein [Candidatus Peregrinibacteria bacterium]
MAISKKSFNSTGFLKCQFHTHAAGDGIDHISHTPKKLIDEAKKLGYDVLSITSHRKVIFTKELKSYAQKKGILLIPGIEFEINGKHILGINIDKKIEKIKTFGDLKKYKSTHKDCLIIAPHPFFPGKVTLKKDLPTNIELFDAVEHSFCYTSTKNYNKEAESIAKKYKLPMIATADCHDLENLDISYSLVESQKTTKQIIETIKKSSFLNKKIKLVSQPISYFKIAKLIAKQEIKNFLKK